MKKLVDELSGIGDDAERPLVWSFDGEILGIKAGGVSISVAASGRRWLSSYSLAADRTTAFPKRFAKRSIGISIWEDRLTLGNRHYALLSNFVPTNVNTTREMPAITLSSRIAGCLLGGACGDALGWPVEFLKLSEIVRTHGPGGITRFSQTWNGQITDDTQMTLFTVEGIIRAHVRGMLKGICHPPGVVHHAYLRWLETQEPGSYRQALGEEPDGWLITEKRLWAQRAPGRRVCRPCAPTGRSAHSRKTTAKAVEL